MVAVVPFVPLQVSPRAEELGQRLAETIGQYRLQHPDLNRSEVVQATQLALARAGGANVAPRVVIALAAAIFAAGLATMLLMDKRLARGESWMLAMLVAGLASAVAVVVALKRR